MGMTQRDIRASELIHMKKLIFTILFVSLFSLGYAQTTVQISKTSKGAPIMFVDSVQISQADLQKLNPNDIASVKVYKDSQAFKHIDSNANGALYVETKQFCRKRFLNYFKSKSSAFKHLLESQGSDDGFHYILHGKLLGKGYEAKLAAINDKFFKSITIIEKKELVDRYGATDKNFGILIVSDEPKI
ncbi:MULTISPECIES: hypothetical protein [Sphingobacterium]|uniref:hypothetical protein n=1 Tax=Sphingobacterium TaxID=28453 RepID=UPI0008A4E9DF|nr:MULTISPECIES: hypothetical protein [Sphingobacterium]HAF35285.1 hypothetical protein [Sphingobacterium sp.]HBX63437.1 hypothetical protein [Flavobacteriaceae bacterium]OFV13019.1 hypothetical protein HMPREF3127_15250 [Sphingobacterium sp. HMSC13C05]QQT62706.1 hypothetical protein I6I97_02485 [Sphingobacterium multivorum]HAL52295.1 hypothetical protein [Sphingobacterium sp.]